MFWKAWLLSVLPVSPPPLKVQVLGPAAAARLSLPSPPLIRFSEPPDWRMKLSSAAPPVRVSVPEKVRPPEPWPLPAPLIVHWVAAPGPVKMSVPVPPSKLMDREGLRVKSVRVRESLPPRPLTRMDVMESAN